METQVKDLVSIIIPVYNTEAFVERCIRSVQNQKYRNIEVIIIDDGSTDNSKVVCECMASQDSRLTVIHKPNGGLSSARNVGIKAAHGKYIAFVDSDDFVHEEYISEMYHIAIESGAEMVICHYEKGKKAVFPTDSEDDVYDIYTSAQMLQNWHSILCKQETVSWNKLVLRDILIKYKFQYPEGVFYEDVRTTHLLVAAVNRIAVTRRKLYYYYQRKNSITKRLFNEKNIRDNLGAQDSRLDFFAVEGYEAAMHRLMIGRQKHYMLMFCLTDSPEIKKEIKKRFYNSYTRLIRFREVTGVEKVMFYLFNIIFVHGNLKGGSNDI